MLHRGAQALHDLRYIKFNPAARALNRRITKPTKVLSYKRCFWFHSVKLLSELVLFSGETAIRI
jgi:hypothetical protein